MNSIIQEDLARITAAPLPWEQFSGATILVTGAAGFLPTYMVETLLYLNRSGVLKKPCRVIALVRNWERASKRFRASYYAGSKSYDPKLTLQVQDVCIEFRTYANYIIHAASQASPIYYKTDPVGTLSANTLGTANMLRLAQIQSDCRGFLFMSSGDAVLPLDPLDIRSCYGESKRMGETMCMAWARQYTVPVRIARISHTYGPGMRLDDGRVFADFTRDILNGGPIVLHSDGVARRCFLYLADATIAFFTILLKGQEDAYNIANPYAEVSIGELADRLGSLFGITVEREKMEHNDSYVPAVIQGDVPNIGKIRSLGWEPITGIEEGFQRTVRSYR